MDALLDSKGITEKYIFDVNEQNKIGRTPLMWAAINGAKSVVQSLLKRKDLLVDMRDYDNRTAFEFALIHNNIEIVEELLRKDVPKEKQVNVNATLSNNQTPLEFAYNKGYYGIADKLLHDCDLLFDTPFKDRCEFFYRKHIAMI